MENVPDMALGDELMILRVMTARLEAIGYDVEARLADAWRFGVPQHRQRLILVARRDGRPFVWPAQGRCKKVSLREAIGDLPRLGRTTGAQEMKARKPTTPFQRRARKGMNGSSMVWDHLTRPVRADDFEAFQLMKPGTRYSELPARLRRYRSDIFNDKYNRLSWDELCRSITAHIAKDGYWYIHPSEHRTLTVRESARVQTFPDNFRFAGTRGHAFRQIGNAVPPALGEGIGRALLAGNKCKPLAPTRRPAARLKKIRSRLRSWSLEDAKDAPWRHPGAPWAVLAGLVLGDRSGVKDEGVRGFLEMFPAPGRGVSTAIRKAAEKVSAPRKKSYLRMANAARALAGRKKNAWESDAWVAAANLGPGEEGFLRTLAFGEDRVLVSSAILRVVGRVMGRESEVTRRGSDGRMLVGRILGVGSGTSELTAGLQALGRALCTTEQPACRRCPLRGVCEGRQ